MKSRGLASAEIIPTEENLFRNSIREQAKAGWEIEAGSAAGVRFRGQYHGEYLREEGVVRGEALSQVLWTVSGINSGTGLEESQNDTKMRFKTSMFYITETWYLQGIVAGLWSLNQRFMNSSGIQMN